MAPGQKSRYPGTGEAERTFGMLGFGPRELRRGERAALATNGTPACRRRQLSEPRKTQGKPGSLRYGGVFCRNGNLVGLRGRGSQHLREKDGHHLPVQASKSRLIPGARKAQAAPAGSQGVAASQRDSAQRVGFFRLGEARPQTEVLTAFTDAHRTAYAVERSAGFYPHRRTSNTGPARPTVSDFHLARDAMQSIVSTSNGSGRQPPGLFASFPREVADGGIRARDVRTRIWPIPTSLLDPTEPRID